MDESSDLFMLMEPLYSSSSYIFTPVEESTTAHFHSSKPET